MAAQIKVRERGLGLLQPRQNAGPVCDDSAAERQRMRLTFAFTVVTLQFAFDTQPPAHRRVLPVDGAIQFFHWILLLSVPPRYRLSTVGRLRAFSVAGPALWNSLPDRLCDPTLSCDSFF